MPPPRPRERHNGRLGALAQLGERRLCKPEVTGSIPVRSIAQPSGSCARTAGHGSSLASCLVRHDSAGVDHLRPSQLDQPLDAALKSRLRAVLAGRRVTEAELRKLFEEGRACSLILSGELEHTEQRLTDLSLDAASSMADLAAAVRRANELRPDLDELHALLAELEGRAREFRVSWLSG
jgi:hypothetical protein